MAHEHSFYYQDVKFVGYKTIPLNLSCDCGMKMFSRAHAEELSKQLQELKQENSRLQLELKETEIWAEQVGITLGEEAI